MSRGTHPLPTLGQGQPGVSGQVRSFRSHPPESRAPAVEANLNSLRTEKILDKLRKDSKFQSSRSIAAVQTFSCTDSRFFFPAEPPEFPSDEVQLRLQVQHRLQRLFVVVGLQKITLPDEAQATTHPSDRGRITGPVKFINQLLATWHLEPEKACVLLGFEHSRLTETRMKFFGFTSEASLHSQFKRTFEI